MTEKTKKRLIIAGGIFAITILAMFLGNSPWWALFGIFGLIDFDAAKNKK